MVGFAWFHVALFLERLLTTFFDFAEKCNGFLGIVLGIAILVCFLHFFLKGVFCSFYTKLQFFAKFNKKKLFKKIFLVFVIFQKITFLKFLEQIFYGHHFTTFHIFSFASNKKYHDVNLKNFQLVNFLHHKI
jgi:hypothetical protein